MPATSPLSLLITPDRRRHLQQRFEQAAEELKRQPPDRARAHELLAECLSADPGNILYLDALLANLRQWQQTNSERGIGKQNRGWWKKLVAAGLAKVGHTPSTKHSVLGTKYSVSETVNIASAPEMLSHSPEILRERHADPQTLCSLATACEACDFDEAELRYLVAAQEVAPDDPETLQMLARALTRQGHFAEARVAWEKLLAIAPDAEAAQAVEDLQLGPRSADIADLPAVITTDPTCVAEATAVAEQLARCGEFVTAEELLANAQAMFGGDLSVREAIEVLQIARSEHRLEIARRRANHDPHPKAQALVGRLGAEHLHLETEILNVRCERLPGDAQLRVDLARKLKRAGNYSGAIQRLEETLSAQSTGAAQKAAVLIELGESWQHLRQFAKASIFYEQAVDVAPPIAPEHLLARYRAATLATAMQRPDDARKHLAAIVAVEPGFRDARERLDKLGPT